ncbi:MAG: FAD-dependent oxidoreductase [Burkholderiales bacterium]|nr:FAD-dependent oxidoreductase [Burkholderiales bacterium]
MISATRTVAVIGGGWAGCAAAVELARAGCEVHLIESARTLGGRARAVEVNGLTLDNGQHIMLGAYNETLRLMQLVGVKFDQAFLRVPLQMRYPADSGGMDFIAPRLPAPLHLLAALLSASGLQWEDKLALARFSTSARWMDWRLNADCSVSEFLERHDQTARLVRLMWRPLCIAALNTPPERASAQVFLNVLRDSLGSNRAASDMLIPRNDLSTLFPERARAYVENVGGKVHVGCTVAHIESAGSGWKLACNLPTMPLLQVESVIVATQAAHAASLMEAIPNAPQLPAFEYEPITTCYLQYDSTLKLPLPFMALIDDPAARTWGQFVFDRGQLDQGHRGLLTVVVSASTDALADGHAALAESVAIQLANVLKDAALAKPQWSKVISEKRATFSCTPSLVRPAAATPWETLFLAGDYIEGDYPATLEGAVISGVAAARKLLKR